ncbi:hypothetical protein D9613_009960 [Agrocybe pediades]|uniref:Uncharacterized protein n=1 Tax=Agrocybe pediades TaxID=84607 RepID=A0A8H4QW87_9AGAR|nr:hypothetical protein D9613_009960 [Agrocybe pediades]
MDPWSRTRSPGSFSQIGHSMDYSETSTHEFGEVRETTYEVTEEVTEQTQFTTTTTNNEVTESETRLQKVLSQSAIGISVSFENPRIKPIMPEAFHRSSTRSRQGQQEVSATIKPLTTTFVKLVPPPGWAHYTHPEGASYFCHHAKRIYTDADLTDPDIFQQALEDISTIEEFIYQYDVQIPDNTDLVIDLQYDEETKSIQTVYFYVHHNSRSIFFLDNFEVSKLATWDELKSAISTRRLHQEIEAQYWLYLQLYPRALQMSTAVVAELRDLVLYFIGNYMSSQTTTNSSYTLDDLYKILTLTEHLEKNIGNQCLGAVSLLSQLMHTFVHPKLYAPPPPPPPAVVETKPMPTELPAPVQPQPQPPQPPPQPPAETDNREIMQRQLTWSMRRTWFIKSTSPLFFGAPGYYLRALQVHGLAWGKSANVVYSEWRDLIFIAMLLLLINVVFLGIHNIDFDHFRGPHRSIAQIASYVSAVFSIGTICLGLIFMRNVPDNSKENVDRRNIRTRSPSAFNLEFMALIYSLPSALLLWSIIAFVVAFTSLCFQHTSKITRIIVGIFFALVSIIFFLCCLSTPWLRRQQEYLYPVGPGTRQTANGVGGQTPDSDVGVDARGRSSATSHTLSRLSYLPTSKARYSQQGSTV